MSKTNRTYRLITHENPKSPISESYRTLRTNIQFSTVDRPCQLISVASARPSEGKTMTISNLAVTYAQEGKKVVLIDGDLRKPAVHRVFQVSNRFGLTQILTDQAPLIECVQTTFVDQLHIIPSGAIPPNPAEMLGSDRMKALLEQLKEEYDIILLDSPPVLAVTDAQIIASLVDGVVLVILEGSTKRALVKKATEQLRRVHAKILGVVLNGGERSKDDYYYYYN